MSTASDLDRAIKELWDKTFEIRELMIAAAEADAAYSKTKAGVRAEIMIQQRQSTGKPLTEWQISDLSECDDDVVAAYHDHVVAKATAEASRTVSANLRAVIGGLQTQTASERAITGG